MHYYGAMVVQTLSPLQPERSLQERKTQWVLETTWRCGMVPLAWPVYRPSGTIYNVPTSVIEASSLPVFSSPTQDTSVYCSFRSQWLAATYLAPLYLYVMYGFMTLYKFDLNFNLTGRPTRCDSGRWRSERTNSNDRFVCRNRIIHIHLVA